MTATTPSDQGKKKDPWDGWVVVEGGKEKGVPAGSPPPSTAENARYHGSGSSWSHHCDWVDATKALVNSGLYHQEFGIQNATPQTNVFELVRATKLYREGYRALLCRTITHFEFRKFVDAIKEDAVSSGG